MSTHRGKENYILKRQLIKHAKGKLTEVPQYNDDAGAVYVVQWETDDQDVIGIGGYLTESLDFKYCSLRLSITPGLYVVTNDIELLTAITGILGYTIEDTNIDLNSNSFKLSDIFFNYAKYNKYPRLVKIITENFVQTVTLYNRFKYDKRAYLYAGVCEYWDPTKFIMFEMYRKRYEKENVLSVPKVIMRWFNKKLEVFELDDPQLNNPSIPVITFDIETVSCEHQRFPTGEDMFDILFTTSIHHMHTNTLYTLVYVPHNNDSPAKIKEKMLAADEYPTYNEVSKHHIKVFNTEVDLLTTTLDLLYLDDRLHYLIGYNSLQYDIKYLLMRAQFYNLKLYTDKFIYRDGYSMGFNQFHIDLYRLCHMSYQLPDYKLSSVSRYVLNDTKTGVDAHNLRYTFAAMAKEKNIITDAMSSHELPSLKDILHYNNYDTILVSKILTKTNILQSIIADEIHGGCISLTSIMSNYDKMQYRAFNSVMVRGLNSKCFICTFKPLKYPVALPVNEKLDDLFVYNVDMTHQLTYEIYNTEEINPDNENNATVLTQISNNIKDAKSKYLGGFNYCHGEYQAKNVQVYDYRIAYPLLIDKKNISDETCLIIPAHILVLLFKLLPKTHIHEFEVYDYKTHIGKTKSESKILQYGMVNYNVYCGKQFEFNEASLLLREKNLIVVLWKGKRGVISETIKSINDDREYTKLERNKLDKLTEELDELKDQAQQMQEDIDMTPSVVLPQESPPQQNTESDPFDFDIASSEEDESEDPEFDVCDGDSVASETMEVILDLDTKGPIHPIPSVSHKSYPFQGEYINGSLNIDSMAIMSMKDPIAIIDQLKTQVEIAKVNAENKYKQLKIIVSSIYGCIGSVAQDVASIITFMIRSTLLASAQYLKHSHDCIIYYCDTDSMIIQNPNNNNLSDILNSQYPYTEIEMKTIPLCFFIKTKTYYPLIDGKLKYGQHTNGPPSWREMVYFFFQQKNITNDQDIYSSFHSFFREIYDSFDVKKKQWYTKIVFIKDEYKTDTEISALKTYLAKNYPTHNNIKKIMAYYYYDTSNVEKVFLRPDLDFNNINTDTSKKTRDKILSKINFYKYYNNMFMTVFNIIAFTVRANNAPFHIVLNKKSINLLMLRAFLDVRDSIFF